MLRLDDPALKGIDLGAWGVLFSSKDKISFDPKLPSGWHLTVHFGPQSKRLDVHATLRRRGQQDEHRRIYSVSHKRLAVACQRLAASGSLERLLRFLQPKRLAAHLVNKGRFVAVVGTPHVPSSLDSVLLPSKRGRVVLDHERLLAGTYVAPSARALCRTTQLFTLYRTHRGQVRQVGYGWAVAGTNHRRLVWISSKRLQQGMSAVWSEAMPMLTRYGRFEGSIDEIPW